jgi:transcriptional regulator GlxA family with amidase domain
MDARVKAVITLMHDLRADELSISHLARTVNLSAARLRQLFKKGTGQSPIQYLKRKRMEKAAALLQSSFLSIKEIVFATGARDVSSFVRQFKKAYGFTPSEFRVRSHRSQKTHVKSTGE